jgi:PAS domain S-box-containing protein
MDARRLKLSTREPSFRDFPGLALSLDPEFRVQNATTDLLERFRRRPNVVIGCPLEDLASGATRARLRASVWPTLLADGEMRDVDLQFATDTGEVIETSAALRLVRDVDGCLLHVVAVLTDTSAGNSRNREHQLALDTVGFGSWIWDLAQDRMHWSERGRALLGLLGDAAISYQCFLATVHPEDRVDVDGAIRRSLAERGDYAMSYRCLWADGSVRQLEGRSGAQWDDAGRPLRLQGVIWDVTGRAEAEERLRHAGQLTALGQLAGGMAHDFNRVLQTVAAAAELLEQRPNDPVAVTRLAAMLATAATRGSAVTQRLLAFARRSELRAAPVAVGPLLVSVRDLLAPVLGASITIETSAAYGLPSILADARQLETVLVNLANNARDAMPTGGTITLTAVVVGSAEKHPAGLALGEYVCIAVADTGTGMDSATLAHATEPFFTTKPVGKGTGLGLAMAREFAELAGGGLEIESTLGHGTTILLWLPHHA